jgi:hypothetical protein
MSVLTASVLEEVGLNIIEDVEPLAALRVLGSTSLRADVGGRAGAGTTGASTLTRASTTLTSSLASLAWESSALSSSSSSALATAELSILRKRKNAREERNRGKSDENVAKRHL